MALIQGIHILAHGSVTRAREIAEDIQQYQRLLVGTNTAYGAGVYAWHLDRLLDYWKDAPLVLFEVDDGTIYNYSQGFFRIPGRIGDYVSIRVLSFRNVW
ncbi:hypothetical protein [Candidatus Entotheonella palauensis]|uniref:hypothetical protein n=1 Tax=Candidatus Entotheonella palauensis TaxID=93172 RepID=UPI000B7D8DAE|nr:hypothetical protein [Candidatus Entotheonella palauensis]